MFDSFSVSLHHHVLHSFPTRRSSDLGAWILNPTFQQLEFSDVDLTVSGSKESIVMVEGGALELSEAEIIKGLEVAHKGDRKSTCLNSSHTVISYAVFCLKKKKTVKII